MLDVTNLIGFGANRYVTQTVVGYATNTVTGGGTSVSCNKPSGVQEGDLMLAFMNQSQVAGLGVWSQPSGWTEVFDSNQRAVSYKVAGPSEPASYSFGIDTFVIPQVAIIAIRPSAYGVVGTISSSTTNPTAPSITVDDSSLVFCVLTQNTGNSTASDWDVPGWSIVVPKFGTTRGDNLTLYTLIAMKEVEGGVTGTVPTVAGNTSRAQLVSCRGVG